MLNATEHNPLSKGDYFTFTYANNQGPLYTIPQLNIPFIYLYNNNENVNTRMNYAALIKNQTNQNTNISANQSYVKIKCMLN
jgi:hypothetical protein